MKVKNETIKKLTSKEMQELGLISIGCIPVRGEAKCRVKGYKTTFKSDTEIHYENEFDRVELVKLDSKSWFDSKQMQDWCVRFFNKERNEYVSLVAPLWAINFVK